MTTKLAEQLTPLSGPAKLKMTAATVLRHNDMSPTAATRPFMHEVMRDLAQILALLNVTPTEFERRSLEYLRREHADMKPPVQVVRHVRKPAHQVDPAIRRTAMLKVANRVADVIMMIDGQDIREWTVGQCLTAGRRKKHEAYVLSVLGSQYQHLDHTKKIGDLVSDSVLMSIIEQGRAHAEQS